MCTLTKISAIYINLNFQNINLFFLLKHYPKKNTLMVLQMNCQLFNTRISPAQWKIKNLPACLCSSNKSRIQIAVELIHDQTTICSLYKTPVRTFCEVFVNIFGCHNSVHHLCIHMSFVFQEEGWIVWYIVLYGHCFFFCREHDHICLC